jgi:hypothetical protein
MNLLKMKEPEKKTNHLIRFNPTGPAFEPSIPIKKGTIPHPPCNRAEKHPYCPLTEDEDFREYYRLR